METRSTYGEIIKGVGSNFHKKRGMKKKAAAKKPAKKMMAKKAKKVAYHTFED